MIKTLMISFLGASRTVFLSFVTYSAAPARRLSFVTYSAAPARRLSFAEPSLEQKINKGRTMGFISYLCG